MRGKLHRETTWAAAQRITPADAGKTYMQVCIVVRCGDHPRGCGENLKSRVCPKIRTGSPPRMRGKRMLPQTTAPFHGITPADAGKTKINLGPEGTVKDHPRRCGENQDELLRKAVKNGSPPQVRGKHNGHAEERA